MARTIDTKALKTEIREAKATLKAQLKDCKNADKAYNKTATLLEKLEAKLAKATA